MPDHAAQAAAEAAEHRHVTFHDQPAGQAAYTGTWDLTATLDIADALDLKAAVQAGAAQLAALGSTETLAVRRSQALGDLARHQPTLNLQTPVRRSSEDETPARCSSDVEIPRVPARQVVLHVHLSHDALKGHDPTARLEHAHTLITPDHVKTWCGSPDTAKITVRPVLDLAACDEVDSDTVPDRHRDQITIRDSTCVFPWCSRPARPTNPHTTNPEATGTSTGHGCDADHIHPRARGGPTCPCNLAPLCRRHHRLKTHTPWTYTTLDPGTYQWTSPHGYHYLKDHTGTHDTTPP